MFSFGPLGFAPLADDGVVVAGGTVTYTYVPTGGVVFSGAAPVNRLRVYLATGGITYSGLAPVARSKSYTPSGGIVFAGAAVTSTGRIRVYVPTGGVTFAGSGGTVYVSNSIVITFDPPYSLFEKGHRSKFKSNWR